MHLAIVAQSLYRLRQRRKSFFPAEIFGEPAWDILLDLFINTARGKAISTTSICIASGVPPTTGLRWLTVLEKKGLLERGKPDSDNRVTLIRLTGKGYQAVRQCLSEWLIANREYLARWRLSLI